MDTHQPIPGEALLELLHNGARLKQYLAGPAYEELLVTMEEAEEPWHWTAVAREVDRLVQADASKIRDSAGMQVALDFIRGLTPAEIRVYSGVAYYRLGDTRSAMAQYERALELDDGNAMARFNLGQAQYNLGVELHDAGERREATRLFHQARRNIEASREAVEVPDETISRLLGYIADRLAGEPESADAGDELPALEAKLRHAEDRRSRGALHSAIGEYRRTAEQAREEGNARIESLARSGLSRSVLMADHDIAGAMAEAGEARKLSDDCDDKAVRAAAVAAMALALHARGDVRQSLELNREALELAEAAGNSMQQQGILRAMANNHRSLGDEATANSLEERASDLARQE